MVGEISFDVLHLISSGMNFFFPQNRQMHLDVPIYDITNSKWCHFDKCSDDLVKPVEMGYAMLPEKETLERKSWETKIISRNWIMWKTSYV